MHELVTPTNDAFPLGAPIWTAFSCVAGAVVTKFADFLISSMRRKPDDAEKFRKDLMSRLNECEESNRNQRVELDGVRSELNVVKAENLTLRAQHNECEARSDDLSQKLARTTLTVDQLSSEVKKLRAHFKRSPKSRTRSGD